MQKWNYSQFLTNFMLDKKSFLICEALFLATQARADRERIVAICQVEEQNDAEHMDTFQSPRSRVIAVTTEIGKAKSIFRATCVKISGTWL